MVNTQAVKVSWYGVAHDERGPFRVPWPTWWAAKMTFVPASGAKSPGELEALLDAHNTPWWRPADGVVGRTEVSAPQDVTRRNRHSRREIEYVGYVVIEWRRWLAEDAFDSNFGSPIIQTPRGKQLAEKTTHHVYRQDGQRLVQVTNNLFAGPDGSIPSTSYKSVLAGGLNAVLNKAGVPAYVRGAVRTAPAPATAKRKPHPPA